MTTHGLLLATCLLALGPGSARAGQELWLVLDAPAGVSDHLSRFRRMDAPFPPGPAPSRVGLAGLRISGSSEFSEAGLRMLRARLPVRAFTVVDLREESHGFAGGLPVSWEVDHNRANVGLTTGQVLADERRRLGALAACERVEPVRLDARYSRKDPRGVPLRPGPTRTEQEVVTGQGLGYERFTVSDHTRPNDPDVDRFVRLAQRQLDSGWMHFHCKAGVGRTTTFMVMADMMKNAARVPRADLIRRQSLLAGYDLEHVHPSGWARGTSRARRDFLHAFFDYCRAAAPAFSLTWSEWARLRRAKSAASASGTTTSTSAR